MIVNHCSLSYIKTFIYNKNGVHFGGRQSALEAALRKTENNKDKIYLHKCLLKTDKFFDCEDQGSHEEWIKVIEEAKKDGFQVIRYINKYEPDFTSSYIVLDSGLIEILSVSVLTAEKAEHEIMELFY